MSQLTHKFEVDGRTRIVAHNLCQLLGIDPANVDQIEVYDSPATGLRTLVFRWPSWRPAVQLWAEDRLDAHLLPTFLPLYPNPMYNYRSIQITEEAFFDLYDLATYG